MASIRRRPNETVDLKDIRIKTRIVSIINLVLFFVIILPVYVYDVYKIFMNPDKTFSWLELFFVCCFLLYYFVISGVFLLSTIRREYTFQRVRFVVKRWMYATIFCILVFVIFLVRAAFFPDLEHDTTVGRIMAGMLGLKMLLDLGFLFVAWKYIREVNRNIELDEKAAEIDPDL